jgi:hypothetical protein
MHTNAQCSLSKLIVGEREYKAEVSLWVPNTLLYPKYPIHITYIFHAAIALYQEGSLQS